MYYVCSVKHFPFSLVIYFHWIFWIVVSFSKAFLCSHLSKTLRITCSCTYIQYKSLLIYARSDLVVKSVRIEYGITNNIFEMGVNFIFSSQGGLKGPWDTPSEHLNAALLNYLSINVVVDICYKFLFSISLMLKFQIISEIFPWNEKKFTIFQLRNVIH